MECYREVWFCETCGTERTYGVQVRPTGPFEMDAIHRTGASLWCRRCAAAKWHQFAGRTEGLPLTRVGPQEEVSR